MYGKDFRLPQDLRPERYQARLAVDLAERTFRGEIGIDLTSEQFRRDLVLHAVDLEIVATRYEHPGGILDGTATLDAESETVTVALTGEAPAGAGRLVLEFRGVMSSGLRGLYRAGPLAVTQFEAADARRVFPCFDEPSFKARWALTLEVAGDLAAVSNGPVTQEETLTDGRRRVTFAETPPISSYLVAMVIGRLAATPPVTVAGVPIQTYAVPEKVHLCGYAQEVAAAALPLLVDYFDIPYAFGKLDQLGIPDFEAGAMENVGAVTFREVALLCDPETAPLTVKKRIAEVITHEAVHMWFGNLVTMAWWDDLWLNEAFATWLAFRTVDRWRPAWRMWLDWNQGKSAALGLDSLASTHPIHTAVPNAAAAGENFDLITYQKGGAVLRMLEGYLGAETFRDGIRRYLKRHAHANATADDLWRALGEASAPADGPPPAAATPGAGGTATAGQAAATESVVAMARSWVHQPGFPLVEATLDGRALELRQRRYFVDPERLASSSEAPWLVPVVARYGDAAGVHEERLLLDADRTRVTLPGSGPVAWLCANAEGRGFYRVAYDAATLDALSGHLEELDCFERIGLIDDTWALLRVGLLSPATVLDLYARFGTEEDHAVLEELGGRLAAIEERLVTSATRPALQRLVDTLFHHQLRALTWDPAAAEDGATRLRRAAVIRILGLVARTPEVHTEARARLVQWLDAPDTLDPNLLDPVVLTATRTGDAELFERLLGRLPQETDPASLRRLTLSLAAFEAPELASRVVGLFLSNTVPLQELGFYFTRLLENRTTREAAWALLRDRFDEVRARAASPQIVRRLVKALALLPERRHLEELQAFLESHDIEGIDQTRAQTLEAMRLSLAFREGITPEVEAWVATHAPA